MVFRGSVRHEAFNQNYFFLPVDNAFPPPTPRPPPNSRSTRRSTARRYASPHTGSTHRPRSNAALLSASTARASLHAAACQPGQPSFPRSVRPRARAPNKPLDFPHTRALARKLQPHTVILLPRNLATYSVRARASSLQPIPPAPSCFILLPYARRHTHTLRSLAPPLSCTLRDNPSLSPHARSSSSAQLFTLRNPSPHTLSPHRYASFP